jgi:hypothetical protein
LPILLKDQLPLCITVLRPPTGVSFSIQRGKSELLAPDRVTSDEISFRFTVRLGTMDEAPNFLGPFSQGPRGGRFVYVNSGQRASQPQSRWDRRAKVPLTGITWALIRRVAAGHRLEARIEGTGRDGGPSCGTVPLLGRGWRVVPE